MMDVPVIKQNPTVASLKGINAIVVQEQAFNAADRVHSVVPPADSDPVARARQMPFPTSYLTQDQGHLNSLDDETKQVLTTILDSELQQMGQITKLLLDELKDGIKQQLELQNLDAAGLAAMYEGDMLTSLTKPIAFPGRASRHARSQRLETSVSPRIDDVGSRLTTMNWDQPQNHQMGQMPSPPSDLGRDSGETYISGWLASISSGAPA